MNRLFNLDHLLVARRALSWAGETHRMAWREVNHLLRSVAYHERRVISCVTKEAYETFACAKRVVRRGRRRGGFTYKSYRCEVCHLWHVTTHRPHERRAFRDRYDRKAAREHA